MNRHILFFLFLVHLKPTLATVVVEGNDPCCPRGFLTSVSAQTYDRFRGTFFVGLTAGTGQVNNGRYRISKAQRPTFTTTPRFQMVLAENSSLLNQTIEFLAFSQQLECCPPLLATVALNQTEFSATTVFVLTTSGGSETQSAALNDSTGNTTSGIMNITASPCHVFAAVRSSESSVSGFGSVGSGIALIGLNACCLSNLAQVLDANTGLAGNLAVPLDQTSEVLNGGTSDVLFTSTGVALTWDEPLDRLYVGLQIQTGTNDTDIGKSVTVGRIDCCGGLILEPIAPNSAISGAPVDEIVVTQGASIDLTAKHLRVMHTTTGPDYLIVNGGTGAATEVCNQIRALPLVNDPCTPEVHGTLANKDAPLTNFVFTIPATAPGELPLDDDDAARVGAGNLPIQPDTPISDIVVVDDAVYVSVGLPQILSPVSDARDTGIFYSQAIFDSDGKIARWTPWVKRAAPFNAFPTVQLPNCAVHNGPVRFFEVDAKTGNIWVVENCTGRVVGITNWGAGTLSHSLPCVLNFELCDGSYSVLDLDQATRGFLNATPNRYALFGGVQKVAFARISQAVDDSNPESPQAVFQDFCCPENFFVSHLPGCAGCVQALEYSRTSTTVGDTPDLNYFFAGTEKGLFALADGNGAGFNASELGPVNQAPFTQAWRCIEAITGSIIAIKTSGASGTLYILASAPTVSSPLGGTLYSIPFAPTLDAMFDPGNIRIVAQTREAPFTNVVQFYGIEIIATGPVGAQETREQVVLATNQGLFRSNADQQLNRGLPDAQNQTQANWQLIPDTACLPFFGVAGMDTPIRQTVWPFNLEDQCGCCTFERSSIHQLSANGNSSGSMALFNEEFPFIPENFNSCPCTPNLATLDPITHFFSDGGRRFFIINRLQDPSCQNQLAILPYHICDWNALQLNVLNAGSLQKTCRLFWVHLIGMSGFLMAGTEYGVVALE